MKVLLLDYFAVCRLPGRNNCRRIISTRYLLLMIRQKKTGLASHFLQGHYFRSRKGSDTTGGIILLLLRLPQPPFFSLASHLPDSTSTSSLIRHPTRLLLSNLSDSTLLSLIPLSSTFFSFASALNSTPFSVVVPLPVLLTWMYSSRGLWKSEHFGAFIRVNNCSSPRWRAETKKIWEFICGAIYNYKLTAI